MRSDNVIVNFKLRLRVFLCVNSALKVCFLNLGPFFTHFGLNDSPVLIVFCRERRKHVCTKLFKVLLWEPETVFVLLSLQSIKYYIFFIVFILQTTDKQSTIFVRSATVMENDTTALENHKHHALWGSCCSQFLDGWLEKSTGAFFFRFFSHLDPKYVKNEPCFRK